MRHGRINGHQPRVRFALPGQHRGLPLLRSCHFLFDNCKGFLRRLCLQIEVTLRREIAARRLVLPGRGR